jgi:hypothetical protein
MELMDMAQELKVSVSSNAMQKIAVDRLESFQQVVQDRVLMGFVTTKNGNTLRKTLSGRNDARNMMPM